MRVPWYHFSRSDLLYAVCISTQVLNILLGGQKIKFSIPFHFVIIKIRLDERITNLVSKFKSDNIWPLFGQRNGGKLVKSGVLPVFDFVGQKGSQMLSDLSSETIGFLPIPGCSVIVPVAMKFWVRLEIARDDEVLLVFAFASMTYPVWGWNCTTLVFCSLLSLAVFKSGKTTSKILLWTCVAHA